MESTETNEASDNPLDHTGMLKVKMQELIDHLRADVTRVDDGRAKALFEVSAEVIEGLKKALSDYEEKTEAAWK